MLFRMYINVNGNKNITVLAVLCVPHSITWNALACFFKINTAMFFFSSFFSVLL